MYQKDAMEVLLNRKDEFIKNILPELKLKEIATWNKYNATSKISKSGEEIILNSFAIRTKFSKWNNEYVEYKIIEHSIDIEGKKFLYCSEINLLETEDLIESTGLMFICILVLFLVGSYLITRRLSRTLWKPFYATLNQIEAYEIDQNRIFNFEDVKIEEFERLNKALLNLEKKNTLIFNNQREFIENAAHELQTPLAIFQAKLNTLMQFKELTTEQFIVVESLSNSVNRLKRLNKNLLLLSKIGTEKQKDLEFINLNELIQLQLDFFKEQGESKGIEIDIRRNETCVVFTNPILLDVMISNLFSNAIKHNVQKGRVQIDINAKAITFANSGQFVRLPDEKLFQRFSKISSNDNGSGLGLSIVYRVVSLSEWEVTYDFKENLHIFKIDF